LNTSFSTTRKEYSFHIIIAPKTSNVQGLGSSCGVLLMTLS
jgi:hypothetical protein